MGNNSSLMLRDEEITDISRETSFNRNQIVRLYSRFLSLDKRGQGFLTKDDFLNVPELAINPLGERIVEAFFAHAGANGQQLNFRFVSFYLNSSLLQTVRPNSRTVPTGQSK